MISGQFYVPRWQIRKQTLIAIEHADKSCPNHPDIIIQTIYTNVTQAKWNLNLSLDFPWFSSTDFLVSSQFRTSERLQRVSKSLTAKEREGGREGGRKREIESCSILSQTQVYIWIPLQDMHLIKAVCVLSVCVYLCVSGFLNQRPTSFLAYIFCFFIFFFIIFEPKQQPEEQQKERERRWLDVNP